MTCPKSARTVIHFQSAERDTLSGAKRLLPGSLPPTSIDRTRHRASRSQKKALPRDSPSSMRLSSLTCRWPSTSDPDGPSSVLTALACSRLQI